MGINFSHGKATWSYTGFGSFRARLAETTDIKLEDMRGFGGEQEWSTIKDPITILLNHSDCDGELLPAECQALVPRLLEIIESWPADDYDKIHGLNLAEGMTLARRKNEPFYFC